MMTKNWMKRSVMTALPLLMIVSGSTADAREVVDMAGRNVSVPDSITKVFVPSPYGSYMMYSIDPAMLVNLKISSEEDKQLLHKAVHDLPAIGRLSSKDRQTTMQALLEAKPDIVLMWSSNKTAAMNPRPNEMLDQLNVPVVYAVAESIHDYPAVYLFLGELLGRQARAKQLGDYFRDTLAEAERLIDRTPKKDRPTVYYAEGDDGLKTECNDSIHVEVLGIAGDADVHRCHTASHMGMEPITLEQLRRYNPDVIIAQQKTFYDMVVNGKDPAWQDIRAVKDGRIYLIPRSPFNWFDRPPSFMRIMGLKWLMNILYPQHYNLDIIKEARDFYRLFLGVDVSGEQMHRIIYR